MFPGRSSIALEGRIQNTEFRTPNPKPQTSNPPSRHRSSLPGPDGHCWPMPWRRPLRRRRAERCSLRPLRLRGTVALQAATDHRCRDRTGIAGRCPGGRPLRRRREMVLVYGSTRLRGDQSPPNRSRRVFPANIFSEQEVAALRYL